MPNPICSNPKRNMERTGVKLYHSKVKLRQINHVLLGLIILVNSYVILAPFIPAVTFWWENRGGTKQAALTAQIHHPKSSSSTPVNHPNSVIIPSMLLDQPILDGPVRDTYKILANGIWRWPNGSTPDKSSNTTLIGHRFTYTQPKGVFYYLDKVKMNDEIGVWWNNKLYMYQVTNIREVDPTETSIEDPTPDARLTIFTCTPLWLPKNRLVVTAALIESSGIMR
jgi:LPXTG-site transpeptidase (sortase) family protein